MKPALALAAIIVHCFVAAGIASAATHLVSDLDTLARIVGETADPGDIIEIQPGTYYLDVNRISVDRSGTPAHPIVIRGVLKDGERPVIDASKTNVRRCVFRVGPGVHDVLFENLDICHAAGSRYPERYSST